VLTLPEGSAIMHPSRPSGLRPRAQGLVREGHCPDGGELPSQRQVRWAQLRVGLTVIFASITLAVLIFLMSGPTGLFTRKVTVRAYFDNAAGLRVGAPVRLEGVDVGNVTVIRVVTGHGLTPVEVAMKVSTRYGDSFKKDSVASLSTAGVLGETFVDIDARTAKGGPVQDGDILPTKEQPNLQDVVRASQGTLQNVDILVRRVDRIVTQIESGQGSIGKLIYDEGLYKKLNATLNDVQNTVQAITQGKGSIGKLVASDELYRKANDSVDKLNKIVTEINEGKGTAGKFIKDPALYNNANATIEKAKELMTDINAGKGALGKFAHDEAFARKLDDTVTKLSAIVDRMEKGEGSVGKLFVDPALYNNADQMLVETRGLVKAIRENPKKYLTIHFKIF
jgi:phospholipid/cholesterol/gamma-HCH transport system substrate-binding protein